MSSDDHMGSLVLLPEWFLKYQSPVASEPDDGQHSIVDHHRGRIGVVHNLPTQPPWYALYQRLGDDDVSGAVCVSVKCSVAPPSRYHEATRRVRLVPHAERRLHLLRLPLVGHLGLRQVSPALLS